MRSAYSLRTPITRTERSIHLPAFLRQAADGAGRRPLRMRYRYFFGAALGLVAALSSFLALSVFAAFTSTSFAVMVYMIVTLSPTLRSPVTLVFESRATSNF